MKKYLDFSQEFGKVDEELIAEAGKPWTIKRGDIFRLYRRKIGQAAAILLAFNTPLGYAMSFRNILYGIQIPITPDKNIPV